jgi:non-heme chloroperoxidase
MFFLASRGYRCIAHDRRGHGRSSQPWTGSDLDTTPTTSRRLSKRCDSRAPCVAGLHRRRRLLATSADTEQGNVSRRRFLIGAIPPVMVKSANNPGGTPIEEFDKLRAGVQADRTKLWQELTYPFYSYNRPGAKVSEGVRQQFIYQSMMCGFPGSYFCIKAFSETDLTDDLKRFDVPTLILHGDDDQIVPIADSALLSAKIVKGATLKVYQGAPHGMCTTHKDRVNEDLLAFIKS